VIDPETLAKDTKLPPIVRLVTCCSATPPRRVPATCSIEPQETQLQVRHRVDGQLRDVLRFRRI